MLWSEVRRAAKGLERLHVEPNKVAFRLDGRLELTCELSAARVIDTSPDRKLDDLQLRASQFLGAVRKHLEIETYTRVGCRLAYRKISSSMDDASREVLSAGLLRVPEARVFGFSGPATYPEVSFRLERENKGVTVALKAEERKVELTLPPGADFSRLITVKKNVSVEPSVVLNIDYFLSGIVIPDQIEFGEWCRQVVHMANRDMPTLLGG